MSDAIQQFIQMQRNNTFADNSQLTLGEIIKKLESIEFVYGDENKDKSVDFDFASAIPTTLDSWRGSYNELALGFKLSGYDNDEEHFAEKKAKDLLIELKGAINKSYHGWKGGNYTMNEDTPVWVSNPGNCGNTGIIDIVDDGYRIVIMTQYYEF
jgi:hypothetical protein